MRRTALGLTIVTSLLFFVGASSAAQPAGDWHRQCYGPDGPTLEEAQTTKCVKHGDGPWERVEVDSSSPGFGFGEVFLIAILLALAPGFVGAAVSSSANISPVAGFLIGTFGSWLGVIALYLYGHFQRGAPQAATASGAGPAVEAQPPPPESAAERLRRLQELLDQGLITQDEYRARRQAAIDAL